jgi:hypothetical protein
MASLTNGNGHGWRNISTIGLIITLGFVFVDKIVMPNVNSGKLAETVQVQAQDIAVLKDVVFTLRYLPAEFAGMKSTLKGVETTVDRIEVNFNKHVDKR